MLVRLFSTGHLCLIWCISETPQYWLAVAEFGAGETPHSWLAVTQILVGETTHYWPTLGLSCYDGETVQCGTAVV